MRGSTYFLAAVVFLAFAGAVSALRAEPPSAPRQDGPAFSPPARITHPTPDPNVAQQDAEDATTTIEQRERDDELIRKEVRGPERRPDLDYDVVTGIQSLNVENALRRR